MKRRIIFLALNGLDERHVSETSAWSPDAASRSPERIVPMRRKRIITFALAAVLILALGAAVYAVAGHGAIGSHAMPQAGDYTDLSELPRIEKLVGYPLAVPERFSDGYVFSRLSVRGEAVYGESGEVEKEFYGVHVLYTKPGAPDRWLDLSPRLGPSAVEPTERRTLDGVEVDLSLDHYKVVPEGYEKTEEDLEREAAGHCYISYGGSGIAEYDFAWASLVLQDTDYMLTDTSGSPDSFEALAQAAAELIAAAK
ncbi:MAG: hypothetical protein IJQ43_01795 [Oscillospiraceae bacterium]|nr:hypothetical protein [Oscillospiraceae bacterium]